MKKILITNGTSPANIGDCVIYESLHRILKDFYKDSVIGFHTAQPEKHNSSIADFIKPTGYYWAVFEKPSTIHRCIRVSKLIVQYIVMKYVDIGISIDKRLHEILMDYVHADIVVFPGGGYFRSQKGITQSLNLLMYLGIFYFAKLGKAKIFVAPISFGPFAYTWHEKVSSYVLKKSDVVMIREKYSLELAQKNGIRCTQASDLGLLLESHIEKKKPSSEFHLGFTLKKHLPEQEQRAFEQSVTDALYAFSKKYSIIVQPIVQVHAPLFGDFDMKIAEKISKSLREKDISVAEIQINHTISEACTHYANVDLLLGMRMHSNIIAAVLGVPFVGIAYEYKTQGVAEELGVGEYIIKCKDVTKDALYTLLESAYNNRQKIKEQISVQLNYIRTKELATWNKLLNELEK